MNPEISKLFDEIAKLEEEIARLKKGKIRSSTPHIIISIGWTIEIIKEEITELSVTLNPQIPEPYASMSRDEILGGIGQYETDN
ncbi:hypothetical protein VNN41_06505 [Lactococcus garvieae]|uniref:hypothetical protein n=1 Tax=Lactococcus garvieae TaxID=1363 RepID=UPI00324F598A